MAQGLVQAHERLGQYLQGERTRRLNQKKKRGGAGKGTGGEISTPHEFPQKW